MRKISTLFKKDPTDLSRVVNEINPENEWVLTNSIATRKFDGTSCAIINGDIYKRYDVKKGRSIPDGAIACQGPDELTGHHPHWVKCDRSDKSDRYHFEAFDSNPTWDDGTYELCGPKIQGNPEAFTDHCLVKHGEFKYHIEDYSFEGIKDFLANNDIEGLVFHEINGERMCKIRKSDFKIKR